MASRGQRTVLSDRFVLGEELGRGAYGQVYKGTDLVSGETVAIKQISLAGISQDNLQSVMGEIELLKTLNHPNIVKYIGSFKTRTHLYIILEFMENGALSALIKPNRFGVFPESLAAIYIAQVLKGLLYLHEQGVVHRDIKGANILTTKEGLVKLADFGVAAKLGELEDQLARRDELQQHVVGTPYWMAPEVIEMTQVTPASDIWSVGCLIIEMLTGAPPYYDLQPMSALFRIVQDDSPPLPDKISSLMADFLMRCFHKDPKQRPGAHELLHHEWINVNRNTIRNSWRQHQGSLPGKQGRPARDHESVTSVVSRMLVLGEDGSESVAGTSVMHPALTTVPEAATTMMNDTVTARIGALPTPLQDGALSSTLSPLATAPITTAAASAIPAIPPPPGPLGMGAVATPPATSAAIPTASPQYYPPVPASTDASAWQGAAAGVAPSQLANGTASPPQAQQSAIVLAGPITNLVSMLGGTPSPGGGQLGPWLQDADRMAVPAATGGMRLSGGQQSMAVGGSMDGRGAGAGVEGGENSGTGMDMLGPTANSMMLELRRQVRELVRALRPAALVVGRGAVPSMSPAAACHALAQLVSTSPDAKQMMMTETGALVVLELLDTDNAKLVEGAMELLLALTSQDYVTLETICLLGVVPAVVKYALTPYPASLRLRTAQFLACFFNSGPSTLAHFVSCQGLKPLVCMVADLPTNVRGTPSPSAYLPPATPSPYQSVLNPQQPAQQTQGSPGGGPAGIPQEPAPGLALSQLAISCIFHFLDCYNILPHNYLCRLLAQHGLVPRLFAVLKETITQLNRPPSSSTGAGSAAVKSNTSITAAGTWRGTAGSAYNTLDAKQVKTLQSAWSSHGALANGMTAGNAAASSTAGTAALTVGARTYKTSSHTALQGSGEEAPPLPVPQLTHEELSALQEAAVSLLLLLSNADALVKGYCCSRDVLQLHLDCLGKLQPPSLIRLMRALRWLSCEHAMLPAIKDAGAIGVLVPFLSKDRVDVGGISAAQVQLEALHTLYNICKFNKVHLEAAATVGITTHLCRMAHEGITALQAVRQNHTRSPTPASSTTPNHTPRSTNHSLPDAQDQQQSNNSSSPEQELSDPLRRWGRLRGFVVPLMITLVSSSSSTRAKLWAAGGPDLFLALLAEQESVSLGVLGALEVWLGEDHARMEPKLTQREPVAQLVQLFASTAQSPDKSMLPALLSVLRGLIGRSSKLAVALALGPHQQQPQHGIVPSLLAMIDAAAPILRVKILEILRCLYEHYPRPKEFLLLHRIPEVLRRLLETGGRGADAVHQEAQRLLTAFQINVLF